jgi:hypothetical protein
MMRFDPAFRFDSVGVDRPLDEVVGTDFVCFPFELSDELFANHLSFPLGVGHPFEGAQKAVCPVHDLERVHERERLTNTRGFVLPHQSSVDIHRSELVAQRPIRERGRDRRIHTARQCDDGVSFAHARADFLDCVCHERLSVHHQTGTPGVVSTLSSTASTSATKGGLARSGRERNSG